MGMVMIIFTKVAMNTFTIDGYGDDHIHHYWWIWWWIMGRCGLPSNNYREVMTGLAY